MKNRKLISTIALFICVLILLSAHTAPALGYEAPISAAKGHAVVYAEKTKWYYRIVNGVLEKRLWSITYNRWLTGWILA